MNVNQQQQRSIAYLCPKCKQSVIVTRDLFQLSATTAEINCPCTKSKLLVDFFHETVEVTIPCHVCTKTHKVSCPTTAFVEEKLLTMSCSGINTCLIGEEGEVFSATPRLEQEADLWEEKKQIKNTPDKIEESNAFLNEIVMEEVLEEIKEIASRQGISCVCGSDKWAFQVEYTSVELGCASCGRITRIPATISEDVENICCCYEIVIGAGEEKENM